MRAEEEMGGGGVEGVQGQHREQWETNIAGAGGRSFASSSAHGQCSDTSRSRAHCSDSSLSLLTGSVVILHVMLH